MTNGTYTTVSYKCDFHTSNTGLKSIKKKGLLKIILSGVGKV